MSDIREALFESLFQIAEDYNITLTNNPDMHRTTPSAGDFCGDVEKAVLDAGYVKPRTITTVEELDGLAVGSVVLDRLDICYRLYNDPAHKEPVWCVVGELAPSSPRGWLPATVLHEGQA